jgi:TrmH RNA methyltransferase
MLNKLTEELAVCGFNAVAALGEYHPETINRLFIREDRFYSFTAVCKGLAERKRPYKVCGDEELERICKSSRHQGVVAMIEQPVVEGLTLDDLDFWAAEGKIGLVLHSVGNDHNFGAMVRSAAFFGAHFVVLSDTDSEARLTTAAYRVAEGGMEHVVVKSVHDTAAFLKAASKKIFTIGTDARARWRVSDLPMLVEEKAQKLGDAGRPGSSLPGFALVIGNEETGLPPQVKDRCLSIVRIPGTGNMESLNAAQAATVFLHGIYEL